MISCAAQDARNISSRCVAIRNLRQYRPGHNHEIFDVSRDPSDESRADKKTTFVRRRGRSDSVIVLKHRFYRRKIHSISSGFTLLELLVVIAIIAVLTSYVAPRFLGTVGKSEIQSARVQLRALTQALDAYRLDMGRYPSAEQGLSALVKSPVSSVRWRGPYLKKEVPTDPWGSPFQYSPPDDSNSDMKVWSWGADQQPNGQGDNEDIYP